MKPEAASKLPPRLTLTEFHSLSPQDAETLLSGVLEHSPHYARQVARQRPFASVEAVAQAFADLVAAETPEQQMALIRAHPDLAGKAALAGELTPESAREQAGAGLGRLTPEQYTEFHRLNAAYHARFDMPYVACVRANTLSTLLAGAAERLENTPDEERERALSEIAQIARFRVLDLLEDQVSESSSNAAGARPAVKVRLGENNYGKAEVNLFKVFRHSPRHEVRELQVRVALTGDHETAHVKGDNSGLLATDTVRNTIYALAQTGFRGSPEEFGQELLTHFQTAGPKVSGGFVEMSEHLWERIRVGGEGHDHSFVRLRPRRTVRVETTTGPQPFKVTSGLSDLYVLKTTRSGWEGYLLDERFTTLPETNDRVMATSVTAKWEYEPVTGLPIDYDAVWQRAYAQIQETFTDHYSPSLQYTLYQLGEAVLGACPEISRVWFQLPNKHHLRYNLERFGLSNDNEIFHVDPEPYGLMEAWVERA